MKLAFVSQPLDGQYPPPRGSISILLYEFARQMSAEYEVTVFTSSSGSRKHHTIDAGVRYEHIPVLVDRFTQRLARIGMRNARRPYYATAWSAPTFIWQIALEIRRRKIDIVHIVNNSQFILPIRRLNPAAKIVLHMECEWLTQLDADLLRPRLKQADIIVGCADYLTQRIRERFPEFSSRCRTVYNGVDSVRFAPAAGNTTDNRDHAKSVLFVGRISPEKGIHVLIEAFAAVARKVPEARLELIGPFGSVPVEYVMDISSDPLTQEISRFADSPSYYSRHLHGLVEEMGLSSRVQFHGSISNFELPRTLAHANVFVFPSVWEEPFGIPVVEAMAAGVPVVSTRSGGIAESVVDWETGLLVERGDPKGLAEAIITLLVDDRLAATMGARGRERAVTTFAYPIVAGQLMNLYREILY